MTIYAAIIFGLLIGSFLNVCIYRVPRKLSVLSPTRSFCPKCEQTLSWSENLPVLSWVLQKAKCRHCGEAISGQYPLVELLSALAAAASVIIFPDTLTAILVYALTASLIVITFIDIEFKIIPNVISFPGMTIGLILGIVSEYTDILHDPLTEGALDSLLGMLAGGGFFYAIGLGYYFVTKRVGLGGGDIKLMGMTGAILGLDSVLPTVFTGSMLGAVAGVFLILCKGGGRQSEIPFGPYLSLGAIIYVFTGFNMFSL